MSNDSDARAADAASAPGDNVDPAAMLAGWRARGEHRIDPVRFRFIEALARRTAALQGDARRILDGKLTVLLAAYGEGVERVRGVDGAATAPAGAEQLGASPSGALAELVEHIAQVSAHDDAPVPGEAAASLASTGELKTFRYFRGTWSRLSAERRLTQSLAKVPDNAGPLNSHHLVHRSLMLMRDLSPEYLNRFMSYVDTLLWVEQVNTGSASAPAGANAPRAESARKTGRSANSANGAKAG
ncbi:DUF2894 domain-containing protein [Variovorax sp. EL159]|uniref:DUF2894 domain-containing protein n=1 Tax=Variovorax sp. EL159 TaxID=1566270 RepID=UPI00088B9C08|nr:DUF2894 domain-containing protein [Variovorax sp. EL159]SCX47010.1 Protein of unknown function [Variovorax sp. EL159]